MNTLLRWTCVVIGLTLLPVLHSDVNERPTPLASSTPRYDCSHDVPANVFEAATLAPFNPPKSYSLLASSDGHYLASVWGDQYGCALMDVWVCDGTGLVFGNNRGICGLGEAAQGHSPIKLTDQGLIVLYKGSGMEALIPDGPRGYYLFAPQTSKWTLLREAPSPYWETPPDDLELPETTTP